MPGMSRMTISVPRAVMREFSWLCNRRGKSGAEVVRNLMQEFVDSRFAEIEARDAAPHELRLFDDRTNGTRDELVGVEEIGNVAAARGPRGSGP